MNLGSLFNRQSEFFIENLSLLLSSGMDPLSALNSLKLESRSQRLRERIDILISELQNGSPLWRGLKKSSLAPGNVLSLIRIGEETGRLSENLKEAVLSQNKEKEFRAKIRSALYYPVIVLILTLTIGIGISWFILPRLATVFAQLKFELPLPTQVLITFGRLLGDWGVIIVPIATLVVLSLIYFIFIFHETNFIGQKILFSLPAINNLLREAELARLGYLLGSLLQAGIPLNEALKSIVSNTGTRMYQKLYTDIQESIEEGNSFQKSFQKFPKFDKLIPYSVQQMIVSAEQSGNLAQTFRKIGENYESRIQETSKNLSVIIEPVLLIIIWLGVVGVALAVILPIYSLIGNFNNPSSPPPPPPGVVKGVTTFGFPSSK